MICAARSAPTTARPCHINARVAAKARVREGVIDTSRASQTLAPKIRNARLRCAASR
jgi:hypothetical protein